MGFAGQVAITNPWSGTHEELRSRMHHCSLDDPGLACLRTTMKSADAGSNLKRLCTVVPAKAGIHNHGCKLLKRAGAPALHNHAHS